MYQERCQDMRTRYLLQLIDWWGETIDENDCWSAKNIFLVISTKI